MNLKKGIAYVRVSTGKQVAGHSIDLQIKKIKAYAELYDIDLIDFVIEEKSAATISARRGLVGALDDIGGGKADCLVIYKLDRLTRSVNDLDFLTDNFFSGEKCLYSVYDHEDLMSNNAKNISRQIVGFAESELDEIRARTKDALMYMREKNLYTGGRPPYGFSNNNGKLKKEKDEQKTLKLIKKQVDRGETIKSIVDILKNKGVLSRTGKPFYYSQVRRLVAIV